MEDGEVEVVRVVGCVILLPGSHIHMGQPVSLRMTTMVGQSKGQ